jgi:hypothetical protein
MSKNALWLLADPAQSWRNLLLDTLYRLQPGLQIPA